MRDMNRGSKTTTKIESWIVEFVDDVQNGSYDKMVLRNRGTNKYADAEFIHNNFKLHMDEYFAD